MLYYCDDIKSNRSGGDTAPLIVKTKNESETKIPETSAVFQGLLVGCLDKFSTPCCVASKYFLFSARVWADSLTKYFEEKFHFTEAPLISSLSPAFDQVSNHYGTSISTSYKCILRFSITRAQQIVNDLGVSASVLNLDETVFT